MGFLGSALTSTRIKQQNDPSEMPNTMATGLPGYAQGGQVSPQQPIVVGEAGPEVIAPRTMLGKAEDYASNLYNQGKAYLGNLGAQTQAYAAPMTSEAESLKEKKANIDAYTTPAEVAPVPAGNAPVDLVNQAPAKGEQRIDTAGMTKELGAAPKIDGHRTEGRAEGGPVAAGKPVVVGEKGPEIVQPKETFTDIQPVQQPAETFTDIQPVDDPRATLGKTDSNVILPKGYEDAKPRMVGKSPEDDNIVLPGGGVDNGTLYAKGSSIPTTLTSIQGADPRLSVPKELQGPPAPETMMGRIMRNNASMYGYRAEGGPMDPNKPYVVGEDGPEVVVPTERGTVIPNSALTEEAPQHPPQDFGGPIFPNPDNIKVHADTDPVETPRTSVGMDVSNPMKTQVLPGEAARQNGGAVKPTLSSATMTGTPKMKPFGPQQDQPAEPKAEAPAAPTAGEVKEASPLGNANAPADPTQQTPEQIKANSQVPATNVHSEQELAFQRGIIKDKLAKAALENDPIKSMMGTLVADRQLRTLNAANPWGSAANHPGILGKIANVAAKVGNVAGDIAIPGVMANIPGTEMNQRVEAGAQDKQLANLATEQSDIGLKNAQAEEALNKPAALVPLEQQLAQANAALRSATTPESKAAAQGKVDDLASALQKGVPQKDVPLNQQLLDAQKAEASATTPEAKAAAHQNVEQITNAITAGQKPTEPRTEKTDVIGPDGKVHEYLIDPITGQKLHDLGVKKEPVDADAAVNKQDRRAAEAEIGKHYKTYTDADKQIAQTKSDLEAAQDGNQVATALAPLENTLLVTSNAGVKRVNKNELDMSQPGAGSIVRKAEAMFDKAVKGELPEGYQKDMNALLDLYKKHNDESYKNNVDSTNTRYDQKIPYGLKEKAKEETPTRPPGASNEIFKDGKVIGHAVNGKYVPLEK